MSRISAIQAAIRLCEAVRDVGTIPGGMDGTIEEMRKVARDVRYGGEWKGDHRQLADALEGCGNGACYMCRLQQKPGCRKEIKEEAAAAIRQQAITIEGLRAEVKRLQAEMDSMRGEAHDSDYKPPEPAEWQREIMERLEDAAPF